MRRMGLTMGFARHHGYDNLAERETEVLGTLLMERVAPSAAERELPLEGQAAELAAALGPALQHLRRRQETPSGDHGSDGIGADAAEDGGPRV